MSNSCEKNYTCTIKSSILEKQKKIKCDGSSEKPHSPYKYICFNSDKNCNKLICPDCSNKKHQNLEDINGNYIKIDDFLEMLNNPYTYEASTRINNDKNKRFKPVSASNFPKYFNIKDIEEKQLSYSLNYNIHVNSEIQNICNYLNKVEESIGSVIKNLFSGLNKNISNLYKKKAEQEMQFLQKIMKFSNMTTNYFDSGHQKEIYKFLTGKGVDKLTMMEKCDKNELESILNSIICFQNEENFVLEENLCINEFKGSRDNFNVNHNEYKLQVLYDIMDFIGKDLNQEKILPVMDYAKIDIKLIDTIEEIVNSLEKFSKNDYLDSFLFESSQSESFNKKVKEIGIKNTKCFKHIFGEPLIKRSSSIEKRQEQNNNFIKINSNKSITHMRSHSHRMPSRLDLARQSKKEERMNSQRRLSMAEIVLEDSKLADSFLNKERLNDSCETEKREPPSFIMTRMDTIKTSKKETKSKNNYNTTNNSELKYCRFCNTCVKKNYDHYCNVLNKSKNDESSMNDSDDNFHRVLPKRLTINPKENRSYVENYNSDEFPRQLPTSQECFQNIINEGNSIENSRKNHPKRDIESLLETYRLNSERGESSKGRNATDSNIIQHDKKMALQHQPSDFLRNSNISYPESIENSAKYVSLKCILEETILSNSRRNCDSPQNGDEERRQARIQERKMKSIGRSSGNKRNSTKPEAPALNLTCDKHTDIKQKTPKLKPLKERIKTMEGVRSTDKLRSGEKPESTEKTNPINQNKKEERIKKKKEEYLAQLERGTLVKVPRYVKSRRNM